MNDSRAERPRWSNTRNRPESAPVTSTTSAAATGPLETARELAKSPETFEKALGAYRIAMEASGFAPAPLLEYARFLISRSAAAQPRRCSPSPSPGRGR